MSALIKIIYAFLIFAIFDMSYAKQVVNDIPETTLLKTIKIKSFEENDYFAHIILKSHNILRLIKNSRKPIVILWPRIKKPDFYQVNEKSFLESHIYIGEIRNIDNNIFTKDTNYRSLNGKLLVLHSKSTDISNIYNKYINNSRIYSCMLIKRNQFYDKICYYNYKDSD